MLCCDISADSPYGQLGKKPGKIYYPSVVLGSEVQLRFSVLTKNFPQYTSISPFQAFGYSPWFSASLKFSVDEVAGVPFVDML